MRSPFPGMDPYLESSPADVHASLLVHGSGQLQPKLSPARRARVHFLDDDLDGRPPCRFIVIAPARSDNDQAETLVDFRRPDRAPIGRHACRTRWPNASLVEVDLFAAGLAREHGLDARYAATITRGHSPTVKSIALALCDRLPAIRVPIAPDTHVSIELQPLVDLAYVNGAYGLATDYAQPPLPLLAPDDEAWADAMLRAAGRRG